MKTLLLAWLICLPLKNIRLNSSFGKRIHPVTHQLDFHYGVDLHARHDTVYAITSGKFFAGVNPYLGYYVRIQTGDLYIIYGHLSQVFQIDTIASGQPLGITGATGRVTGEHLHISAFALEVIISTQSNFYMN